MARPKPNTAKPTGLHRVRGGKLLLWPPAIMNQLNTPMNARGKSGYVVDMDKPYEQFLCRGMHKFLEPVPDAQEEAARAGIVPPSRWPRPVVNHLADMNLLKRTPPIRASAQAKLAKNAAALAPSPPDLIPGLDEPSSSATKRKPKPTGQATIEGADL